MAKGKCTAAHPEPPCPEGQVVKKKDYKDGSSSECCYKDLAKKPKPNQCNARNPPPPCQEGYEEKDKVGKDGTKVKCCFAIPNYKAKLEQVEKRAAKAARDAIEKDIMAARAAIAAALRAEALRKKLKNNGKGTSVKATKVTKADAAKKAAVAAKEAKRLKTQADALKKAEELQKVKSTNCNKRNPAPPCEDGFEESIRVLKDGSRSRCCYKKKLPAKKKKKTTLCTKRNPVPPCQDGYEEQVKKNSDGDESTCCYKSKVVAVKTKQVRRTEKVSLFAEHDSLMEFDPIGEVRKPEKQLVSKLSRHPKGMLVSSKFDGHRMLYDNVLNEGLSRTGKTSFNLPDNWKAALSVSPMHLDGEIFLPGLPASQVAALRTGSSLGRKLWTDVAEYHVFDLPTHKGVYTERIEDYTKIVGNICKAWGGANPGKKCPIRVVEHVLLKTPEEIKTHFKKVMSVNYKCPVDLSDEGIDCTKGHPAEGVVLSDPDGHYEFKRSLKKYKYKERYDGDCTVIEPHPLKQSILVYRNDCEAAPSPNAVTFYMSTEGMPKEYFLPGDILKYTCLGFTKGISDCPQKPKMAKFKEWRTEEIAKAKKKLKLPPPPRDGPNELAAQYFDKVANGYYNLKQGPKGSGYKKTAAILRRTDVKIDLTNWHEPFGKGSMGTQLKCVLEGKSFEECVGDRLKGGSRGGAAPPKEAPVSFDEDDMIKWIEFADEKSLDSEPNPSEKRAYWRYMIKDENVPSELVSIYHTHKDTPEWLMREIFAFRYSVPWMEAFFSKLENADEARRELAILKRNGVQGHNDFYTRRPDGGGPKPSGKKKPRKSLTLKRQKGGFQVSVPDLGIVPSNWTQARQSIVRWIRISERDANDLLEFLTPGQVEVVANTSSFEEIHRVLSDMLSDF